MSNIIKLEEHEDANRRTYDKDFQDISSLSDEECESENIKKAKK
jgi:hypothetical protein